MKSPLIHALLVLPAFIIVNASLAQSDYLAMGNSSKLQQIMAYYVSSLDDNHMMGAGTAVPDLNVNEKVLQSFNKNFKNAGNPQWYATNKDKMYIAYFDNEGRKSKALFRKSGYMIYAISDGAESSMNRESRKNIKSNYVDYTITQAKQVTTDDLNAWVVNLHNGDNIIVVSEVDGLLYELHNFSTAPVTKKTKKSKVIIGTTE